MGKRRDFLLLLAVPALVLVSLRAFPDGQGLILMYDQGANPGYRASLEQFGRIVREAVGTGFTPVPYPDENAYVAAVSTALPTDKAPDLFAWGSKYRMKDLVDKGLVEDLTDLWDKHRAEYPRGVRDALTFNGKVYGFCDTVEYWGVWYNKAVFARYDLTVPFTWDQFLKVCETLKRNGVIPLTQTVQGRWPAFILFEEMVARQDPQLYLDLCEGRARYSDPTVKQAFAVWADLIGKGYFTDPSVDLFSDVPRLFAKGEVAMVPCGSWYLAVLTANGVPEDDAGIFIIPPVNPRAGKVVIMEASPVLIGARAANLDAAGKVADWWMGQEGNAAFARLVDQFPANAKADVSFLPASEVALKRKIVSENYRVLNRYWEATPTPICEKAVDKFAEFILRPSSMNQVLSDLDRIAAAYWSKSK